MSAGNRKVLSFDALKIEKSSIESFLFHVKETTVSVKKIQGPI